MAYEARHLRRQKIRYNNANDDVPLKIQLINNGAKLTPSAATIAVYNPSGTELVSATSTGVTISGTLVTYSLDTTTTASYPLGEGYRAHWVLTSSSITYETDQIFDIVNMVPFGRLGRDQLVALDDRVRAMEHDADEDFSELIEAVRDIVQFRIESKAKDDGRILEDMILDENSLAVPTRMLALSQIFREKGMPEDAEFYRQQYEDLMISLLASARYDADQGLEEDGEMGTAIQVRLVT